MKILFFVLLSIAAFCQKKLPVKQVVVTDGMDYEYILLPKQDSLRWYNGGLDTFKVSMRFEKLSAGFPLPDIITHVDDNFFGQEYATYLSYVPAKFSGDNIANPLGWNFAKNQLTNVAHHNNTLSFLQTDGWVEYTFAGYKIEYWAEQLESYGISGVSIDKGPEVMIDLYADENVNNSRMVFVVDSLSQDVEHTIRVRYTAQRNPNANSSSARINLDKFVTYHRQGIYYPPKK